MEGLYPWMAIKVTPQISTLEAKLRGISLRNALP